MFKQNKLLRIVSNYIQDVYMQPEAQYDASDCLSTDNPGQEPLHPMGEPGEKTVLTIILRSVARAVSTIPMDEEIYDIGEYYPATTTSLGVKQLEVMPADNPRFPY